MKKISSSCRLLGDRLRYKYRYFSRRAMLSPDGSFYYDDKRLAEELYLSEKTVMRCKRRLRDLGEIDYKAGRCRGSATNYWIPKLADKTSLFATNYKSDILSEKHDKLVRKAPRNVTPNNINNEFINNRDAPMNEEQIAEMHTGFQNLLKCM